MTGEGQRCVKVYETTEKPVDNKVKDKRSAENVDRMEGKWF